jgi:hypothetical protein
MRNRQVYNLLEQYISYFDFLHYTELYDHNDFVWNREDYIFTRGIDRPFLKNQHWGGKNGKYEVLKDQLHNISFNIEYHTLTKYHERIFLPTNIYFKDNHYYFIDEIILLMEKQTFKEINI